MDYEYSSRNSFAALLDAAVDAIIVIDQEGTILVVNPAATRLFGYERDEVLGRNVKMFMPQPDRDQHDSYLHHYLETGERKIIGIGRETTGQKKDQTHFPMYLSVGHIENSNEANFVAIIRDLSAQQQQQREVAKNEMEIQRLQDRLIHIARISTLGEMVTGIAHEVNQPLTAISVFAQSCIRMINTGLNDPKDLLEAQYKIASQAERAGEVIKRIRSFSKPAQAVHKRYDCHELISEVAKLAETHATELGITIKLERSRASPLLVMVDAIQIQQVALNLINNAVDSMIGVDGDKVISINMQKLDEETVEVSISDHGEGLDETIEEQVFDTFFTTKSAGLGIGLSICQSIIVSHGGKIYFRRNPLKGCTFYFTLPTAVGKNL